MSRSARIALSIVLMQAAFVGAYWLVESRRSSERRVEAVGADLGTASPQRVNGRLPLLSLRALDGSRRELRNVDRATLVHFWATWCPPCRTELPSLLAVQKKHAVDVVAIALDQDLREVERFLEEPRPESVFLADSTAATLAFGIQALPVTFLVGPGGLLRLRFEGARDWSDPEFSKTWVSELAPD